VVVVAAFFFAAVVGVGVGFAVVEVAGIVSNVVDDIAGTVVSDNTDVESSPPTARPATKAPGTSTSAAVIRRARLGMRRVTWSADMQKH
jgi:hypothetical protein